MEATKSSSHNVAVHATRRLSSGIVELATTEDKFGWLSVTPELKLNPESAKTVIESQGYLYIPGFLDRARVLEARGSVTQALADEGALDSRFPVLDAVAKEGVEMYFRPDIAHDDPAVQRLVYGEDVLDWFERFLGGPVRHYDFTWMRVVAHGKGTWPHCDIVYMGRGTTQLYTMWAPLGDVPLELGGLIVLENSHRISGLRETYGRLDVDVLCENKPGMNELEAHGYCESGAICLNPARLRDELGGRWLTSPKFQAGDVLIFGMHLVHASLDNQTDFVRLSTDTRYQLASEPIDPRWIDDMPGHGEFGKKIKIC